jgi:hypothetical protein
MDGGESVVIKRMVIKYKDCHIVNMLRQLEFLLDTSGEGGYPEMLFLKNN